MPKLLSGRKRLTILLLLILAGEAVFLLPFVLARIFRPTLLIVYDITNLELGTCFSIYGVVAMLSYFFGGPLADRFPSRNLIAIGLWTTALGGLVMVFVPAFNVIAIIYGFWGFTTIFLFWAALIRATREWGGTGFQGRAFGLLEGGRGLTAALIATFALLIFSWFMPVESHSNIDVQRTESYQIVILSTSIVVFLIGILVWFFVPKKITRSGSSQQALSITSFFKLLKMPTIWMMAVIIVCAYVGYKITDDYTLYANEVLGFNEVSAAGVGTMAFWMRPVFAVMAGFAADRFEGTKVIIWCFALMIIGGLLTFLGVLENVTWLVLTILATTLIGVYGLRGIYFAVMKEAGIPLISTGAAVGIMSIVGYTPDVFMGPLMGFLLDEYPGVAGHQYVFLVLMLFSIVGLIVSITFRNLVKR
ncbi:nitrate/nitrite transporter [Bacteroidota bacterium]